MGRHPSGPAHVSPSILLWIVVERFDLFVGDAELRLFGLVETAAQAGIPRFDDAIRLGVATGPPPPLVTELAAGALPGAKSVRGAVETPKASHVGAAVRTVARAY